jgi:hypothetical protein
LEVMDAGKIKVVMAVHHADPPIKMLSTPSSAHPLEGSNLGRALNSADFNLKSPMLRVPRSFLRLSLAIAVDNFHYCS